MQRIIDLFLSHPIYYFNYLALAVFTVIKHRDIWKAACGGNHQIQLTELAQLFALYFFFTWCNEVIFNQLPADIAMVLMLLGVIGVAGVQKLQNKTNRPPDGTTV